MLDLDAILDLANEHQASTVHLRAGSVPVLRVLDQLVPLEQHSLEDHELDAMARSLLSPRQQEAYERDGDVHFLYHSKDTAYKANFFQVVDGHGLVLKKIVCDLPSLDELGLPSFLEDFLGMRSGLVLLTGPMGCGKSTTQNALINSLNASRDLHVLTVENPIEHMHGDGKSLIQQCEVGRHVATMHEGIELARRVQPDILFVSEIFDRETLDAAVDAAENGLLVVAAVHASSVTQALSKIEELFDQAERAELRQRLATCLRVVACQVLVHKQYGSGKVPVFEILTSTAEVRGVLSDGTWERLHALMEKSRGLGMCSLDDALYEKVVQNKVLVEEAVLYAVDKDRFEACRRLPQLG